MVLSVVLAAAAALLLCLPLFPDVLTVRSREGKLLWRASPAGNGFTVGFTHSANKGHVTESYSFLPEGGFTLSSGTFESYGAGMLDQLPPGVVLRDAGDYLELTFPVVPMEELSMIPGSIAEHTLWGEGYSVSLAGLSPYSGIVIRRESVSALEMLLQGQSI